MIGARSSELSGFRAGVLPRFLVLSLALAFVPVPVAGQYEDREVELERIRGRIAELQASLSRLRTRERSLRTLYEETSVQLELQEQKVAEARAARELAQARVEEVDRRIRELEEELERVRDDLHDRLVTLYRLGRAGYLRLLVAIDERSDVLEAMRQVRYLARRDDVLLNRYADAKARLALREEEAREERARVSAWFHQEESRRRRLAELETEQQGQLARLERERTSLASETSELAEKERKLANFLSLLYGRNTAKVSGTPIQDFRGVLEWPVEGRVKIGFGPRRHPRYETRIPHNGLELGTRPGDPVKAVYPGEVLYAAPFKGYGMTVIVHHPGKVFSLYAGLAGARVKVGDMLSLGQIVGLADDSLYFEIRDRNRPRDPTLWLRN